VRFELEISLSALGGALVLLSAVLHACTNELVGMRERFQRTAAADDPLRLLGRPVPRFRAEMTAPQGLLRHRDLAGGGTLLFVDSIASTTGVPRAFETMVQIVLHRSEGTLYVICRSRDECRALQPAGLLGQAHQERIRIVADDAGHLRRLFRVKAPWTTFTINSAGRIARVGLGEFTQGDSFADPSMFEVAH
jgi:hypothetical protein